MSAFKLRKTGFRIQLSMVMFFNMPVFGCPVHAEHPATSRN